MNSIAELPRLEKEKITITVINIQIVRKRLIFKVEEFNKYHRTETRETRKREFDTGAFFQRLPCLWKKAPNSRRPKTTRQNQKSTKVPRSSL